MIAVQRVEDILRAIRIDRRKNVADQSRFVAVEIRALHVGSHLVQLGDARPGEIVVDGLQPSMDKYRSAKAGDDQRNGAE
jgi:hypothetical protein